MCGFKCCICFTITSITIIVLAISIFAIIFQPQDLKFIVTDASLAQFDLSSADNRTLSYDLALNVTIRNPNKKVGVFFDRIQVIANYRKKRLSLVTLNSTTPFYQGHKNTTVLPTIRVQGQKTLSFKERDVEKYDSERSYGAFNIDVKLVLHTRARYGKMFKIQYYGPYNKIDCDKLKIPLINSSNATSSSFKFKSIKCQIPMVFLGYY